MRTLGNKSAKAVLVLHFCSLALWLGGVLSCLPLLFQTDTDNYDSMLSTYIHMRQIAWNVIGWGGIGSLFTGLALALFTQWGLFRQKWVMAKFFITIGLILFGMFFNEHRILRNIEILENYKTEALLNEVFLTNHATLKMGMVGTPAGFILLIIIAVYKPWMSRRNNAERVLTRK